MTTPPLTPAPAVSSPPDQPAAPVDFVLAGRAMSTGEFLSGLMVAGQLKTVGTPRKLPMDLFPDADPDLVREIWDRAAAVVWQAAKYAAAPRFYRDELARLRGELEEAGHHAMGGMVGRSLSVAQCAPDRHPADDEEGRER